jgi:endonuclease/exonuclease/phosphatase (EEP) superfamily protein YafD
MFEVRVAAFNAHDNAARYWDQITMNLGYSTDIRAIPEAYKRSEGLVSRLQASGLAAAEVPYGDQDRREDHHYFAMVGNPEAVECIEPIQLAGRTALRASLKNGADVIGVHFDDRKETTRREQTEVLLAQVNPNRPTIIAGDMNSMHRNDLRARLLRSAAPITELLPQREPGRTRSRIARICSLATRLTRMAEGGPIAMLEAVGYKDADPARQATMGFVQIDHIMVPEWMAVADFTVRPMEGLSDHRAILAQCKVV